MASFLDPEYWRKAQSPQGNSAYGSGGLLDSFLALPQQQAPYRPNYNPVGSGGLMPVDQNLFGGGQGAGSGGSENTGSGDNQDYLSQFMGGNYNTAGMTGEEGSGWNVPTPGYKSIKDFWDNGIGGFNGLGSAIAGGSPFAQLLKLLGQNSPFNEKATDTGNMITSGGDYGNNDEYAQGLAQAQGRGFSAGMDNTTPGHLGANIANDLGVVRQQQLGAPNPFSGFQIQQPQYTPPNNNALSQTGWMTGAAPQLNLGFHPSSPEAALAALLASQSGYGGQGDGTGDVGDGPSIWDWQPEQTDWNGDPNLFGDTY